MHRFYLPAAQLQAEGLKLTGPEAHHALHVMRIRTGDRLLVLDGAGHQFLCQAAARSGEELPLDLLEKQFVPPPAGRITLLQALPKGKLIETIIQKATELGTSRIVPLLSERVVHQLNPDAGAAKAQKWQAVAIEAIKQCGAAWLPVVEPPQTPQQFLARKETFELPLVASLHGGAKHPSGYFRDFRRTTGRAPQSACAWVGPEGDFTPDEIEAIQAGGALPITLGNLVLRSETAAVYCLSILNYEFQAPPGTRD